MARTEEYYLSKGFDLPTAKYYANGRRKIVSVTPALITENVGYWT